MRKNQGITLTSLVVYIISLLVLVGTMATLTKYFYKNLDEVTIENKVSAEYIEFTNYLTNDTNSQNIENVFLREDGKKVTIKFTDFSAHRYQIEEGSIYYVEIKDNELIKKIRICRDVDDENSNFSLSNNILQTNIKFNNENTYTASYTIE